MPKLPVLEKYRFNICYENAGNAVVRDREPSRILRKDLSVQRDQSSAPCRDWNGEIAPAVACIKKSVVRAVEMAREEDKESPSDRRRNAIHQLGDASHREECTCSKDRNDGVVVCAGVCQCSRDVVGQRICK